MSSTVVHDDRPRLRAPAVRPAARPIRIGLLGLGRIGSAVAHLAGTDGGRAGADLAIDAALVRNVDKHRGAAVPAVTDPEAVLDARPDVIVEALGGVEPARAIVLEALSRGIPVVTANKTLVARCGEEIIRAARHGGTALRYEAAVLAGVPFLGTFATRPFASRIAGLSAILNGTSNVILTDVEAGHELPAAIESAQRRGFAEPDPAKDLDGTDAAEKLTILLRHFAHADVDTDAIERRGISALSRADLSCATAFGGAIRPVAVADWSHDRLTAWVGPAFVRPPHPLFAVRGVANAICLAHDAEVPLVFSGPGAGPAVTAATILDDVLETAAGIPAVHRAARPARLDPPAASAWLIRLTHRDEVPDARAIADLLSSFDVWGQRSSEAGPFSRTTRWVLTHACDGGRVQAALTAVAGATGCETLAIPALEAARG